MLFTLLHLQWIAVCKLLLELLLDVRCLGCHWQRLYFYIFKNKEQKQQKCTGSINIHIS